MRFAYLRNRFVTHAAALIAGAVIAWLALPVWREAVMRWNQRDYGLLVEQCDGAMRDHYQAKMRAADEPSRDTGLALQAGEVVSADRLQAKPAVVRGEWASLVTRQGPLSLESRVEVLQDGQPGQIVRARPANATGVLSARVVGRGQLELQP